MCARVVLLAGPSGSGKSRLAARSGLPILQLDDFYKDGDDPTLPRFATGEVDWDDPRSWNAGRAVDAVRALAGHGRVDVPVYDIAANGVTGTRHLDLRGAGRFIAEGIFAAEIVAACRSEGLLAQAICVQRSRWMTMVLRFTRDLREHRKPVPFLIRRGWYLARREPSIVAGLVAKGCVCRRPAQVERYLRTG